MILSIGDIGYAPPSSTCDFMGNEIDTTNYDTNITATTTENINITSHFTWGNIENWKFNVTTIVPLNYNINPNINSLSCPIMSVVSGSVDNLTKYYTYNGLDITQIHCEFKTTSQDGEIYINTNFNTNASPVNNDITDDWYMSVKFAGYETCYESYSDEPTTSILAPNLQIQNIYKYPSDGYYTDYTYINTNFTWNINAQNYYWDGEHTGKAFGVYSNMTYNETAFTPVNCNPENISHGDIEYEDENTSGCTFSANVLGTYHFDDFFISDWSGYYNNYFEYSPKYLYVVNLTVNGSADNIDYNEPTEIQATVKGIASEIESVNASWNYTRINDDTDELEIASSSCIMNSWDSGVEKNYKCYPTINSSGRYNVTFDVLDIYGSYNIEATNKTTFDVAFGIANVTGVAYNYDNATALILKNQTFNITTFIDIQDGDVWGLNVSIESSNPEIINVSNIANQTYVLGNLRSWDWTNVTWHNIYANNSGLVKLTIKTTALNGTGVEYDKYPQIVDILVGVNNDTLNIGNTQKGQVKFAGNFSNIELLNLTIKNEFGLFYNKTIYDYYTVDADECYKLEGESHNVALPSYGAFTSSGGGLITYDPNASIDNNPSSNWYGITTTTGSTELNITFNESQSLQGIELLWNDNNGNANVSAYYYYESDGCVAYKSMGYNENPNDCVLIEEKITNNHNPPNTTNTTIFEQIRAGVTKIRIIQSANNSLLNIYSLEAYTTPVTDYEPPCMIFNFTYDVPRSGIYQITPEITLNKSSAKRTNANNFFVNYGTPEFIFGEKIMILGTQQYQPKIKALNGDLRNITINLSLSNNLKVPNFSSVALK